MKHIYRGLFCLTLLSVSAFAEVVKAGMVKVGVDRFFEEGYEKQLSGKRVGIITNQTGVTSSLQSTIELFLERQKSAGYQVKALFGLEHGLSGDIYAGISYKDSALKKEGLPIFSLHGDTRRPTDKMLDAIDVFIYDVQDIGCRSYTYATALFYVMEAAAKRGIPVIVLDRPNPMGGLNIDGPMLEEAFRSYIGYINIPYCHGLTIGELARYFNEEYKVGCALTVVPMAGWNREMAFRDTGLPWVPTSPNIPEPDTAYYYASTGILGELSLVNIGIGYTMPFKIVGAPWIDADLFAAQLNQQKLPGVYFTPFHYQPFYGSMKDQRCHGVQIHITDRLSYRPLAVQYLLIGLLKSLYPAKMLAKLAALSKEEKSLFCKANGSDTALIALQEEKYIAWKLINSHKAEREQFIEKRKRYLIYGAEKESDGRSFGAGKIKERCADSS